MPIEIDRANSILDDPLIHFGREVCGDLPSALRREWLVTNGLGGYASGTLAGINTRRYHGLLVAALEPPVLRTVLVGGMVEQAQYAGCPYALSTHEYADGTIDGHSYRHLQSFRLEGTLPVWTFALADAVVERRLVMVYGQNTTCLTYRVLRATEPIALTLTPLVTYRDFHALTSGQGWAPSIEAQEHEIQVQAFAGATPFRILTDAGAFLSRGDWYWNFLHREETARGLDDRADLFAPGDWQVTLAPDEQLNVVMSTERDVPTVDSAFTTERTRQAGLLQQAGTNSADRVVQQLTLAADQFMVRRSGPDDEHGQTVIAGYHWFNDWGRDTMIALPGLTLATGRSTEAADILRTFARYVEDGLLPNNFADRSGMIPGYNTADATLWYFLAIRAYVESTGDTSLVEELLPVLKDIVNHHISGTRFGIGVDQADGLLRAGEPGWQITWMDAKVGDWVVTPRIGKPVEINALWYNTLCTLAELVGATNPNEAKPFAQRAAKVRTSFRQRFVDERHEWLADVVDGPEGTDWTLRPNQILAVSLPYALIEGSQARSVVTAVGRSLATGFGLRSLTPDHQDYHGTYGGDTLQRDGGYHQGPVWSWLAGAFAEAHCKAWGDRQTAFDLLRPLADHLTDAGLGSISEILDGEPPHFPRGCIAQAWGVAETLRVWRALSQPASTAAIPPPS